MTQADVQSVETVWSGSNADGFLTASGGGTNGHTVTFTFDWVNAAFVEAVQDAIGQAAIAGVGITYDDALNAISAAASNLAFNNGVQESGGTVSVKPDPASPSTVSTGAAGLSIQANVSTDANQLATLGTDNKVLVTSTSVTALATVDVQDSFGNHKFYAFP